MMRACCSECPFSCCWCSGQAIPLTCGITQFLLRRKVLDGDMSKYKCCQGYYNGCCCCTPKMCCDTTCPTLCLCLESFVCNFAAVSASRNYVMDKYDLSSDPCDYRLIAFANFMQCLACICRILGTISSSFRHLACIVDCIADTVYALVTGCMTAQTAHEVNYQNGMVGQNQSKVVPQTDDAIPVVGAQVVG